MQNRRATVMMERKLKPTGWQRLLFSTEGSPWSGYLVEEHASPDAGYAREWSYLKPHIVLHTKGRAKLCLHERGRTLEIVNETDTVSILPKGYDLSFGWSGHVDFMVVEIDDDMLARLFPGNEGYHGSGFVARHGLTDPTLTALMRSIETEIKAGSPCGPVYGETLSLALTLYLKTHYSSVRIAHAAGHGRLARFSRLQRERVVDYVQVNLERDLGLAEMAALLELGPRYFCTLFRNTFGVSPHQYVLGERVTRAKHLLTAERISLVEIATMLGFSTQSHFTEVFRKFTGTTPRRYREHA